MASSSCERRPPMMKRVLARIGPKRLAGGGKRFAASTWRIRSARWRTPKAPKCHFVSGEIRTFEIKTKLLTRRERTGRAWPGASRLKDGAEGMRGELCLWCDIVISSGAAPRPQPNPFCVVACARGPGRLRSRRGCLLNLHRAELFDSINAALNEPLVPHRFPQSTPLQHSQKLCEWQTRWQMSLPSSHRPIRHDGLSPG